MSGRASEVKRVKGDREWAEMVPDALGLIFNRLSLEEKLQVVPRVCKPWRHAVNAPGSWTKIDIHGWTWITMDKHKKLHRMLRMLVTRSAASLRQLYVSLIDDAQLSFIADHASSLQVLSVQSSSITDSMVEQVAPSLSSLTTIDLSHCNKITARSLSAIGTNCASLESLTFNADRTWCPEYGMAPLPAHDNEGRAIAKTMPKLKRLSISYVNIDSQVALEILEGCPELEWLNIKGCWRVNFRDGLLEEKYPKIEVVDVDHEDPGDDDYDDGGGNPYECYCCACVGMSAPAPDYTPDYTDFYIEYYSL